MALNFDTSDAPHITILRCAGDLSMTGTDPRQITLFGDDKEFQVERQGESFTITARKDCDVRCPPGTSVTIKQVDGELSLQGLTGPLAVELAASDATLRDVGPATLRQVNGDLEVRGLKGELRIEQVKGDAKVRQTSGAVTLDSVNGDLAVRDLSAGAAVKHVGGDVSLSTAVAAGASYRVEAGGDIAAKVDVGSGARLTLEGCEVHCRLPLKITERASGRIVGTLGDGSAELILRANGNLSLTERGESWGGEGSGQWESTMESWTQQFEAQMAEMQRKLEERLAGIPYVDAEDVARRAREAADRARRQAERSADRARMRAERASRKAERAAEHARTKAERAALKHERHAQAARGAWAPPPPARPTAEPVSDTERIAILKMVETKKITADEAARLLAALEGQA